MRNCGLTSTSSWASSASLGCSGKDADEDLQVLTAQDRKFMLRTFILTKMIYFYECRGVVDVQASHENLLPVLF